MLDRFGNLSPADFEDLVRDLVGRELGVRFEAFAAGPDGGMDGRHAKDAADRTTRSSTPTPNNHNLMWDFSMSGYFLKSPLRSSAPPYHQQDHTRRNQRQSAIAFGYRA
jgi:hypothetical protein